MNQKTFTWVPVIAACVSILVAVAGVSHGNKTTTAGYKLADDDQLPLFLANEQAVADITNELKSDNIVVDVVGANDTFAFNHVDANNQVHIGVSSAATLWAHPDLISGMVYHEQAHSQSSQHKQGYSSAQEYLMADMEADAIACQKLGKLRCENYRKELQRDYLGYSLMPDEKELLQQRLDNLDKIVKISA